MKKSFLSVILLLIGSMAFADSSNEALNINNLSSGEKQELLREVLKSGNQLKLNNLKTNKIDTIEDPYSMTKDDALMYLPDVPEIVEMFNIYALDNPPYAALIKTYGELQKLL